MKIYLIWLISVILWNFSYSTAALIEDVVVAVLLSLLSYFLKLKVNFKLIRRKIYILVIAY